VNLTGAFNVLHAFLPALARTGGDVVVVGSVSGRWPDRSGPGYQASKGGVHALVAGAGFEAPDGVRFTTVMPGMVDTPIMDRRPEPPDDETRARMLRPEHVAQACLFAVGLPPGAHVPEITILPAGLQAIGRTALGASGGVPLGGPRSCEAFRGRRGEGDRRGWGAGAGGFLGVSVHE
jgi:NADP-dependent 3-hydroxy acid dehydrogenase YdfG